MARRTVLQEPRFYWRGRALGGSSTVNAQIAIRGVPAAFDGWAEAGCKGWAAKDVLPLYDLIEDDAETAVPGQRGGGPLPVFRMPFDRWGPVDRAVREAALACGYPWKENQNAPEGEGVSCHPINIRAGHRVTTNDAYLEPIRERANLEIRGEALVDPVVFDGRRAIGVRVRFGTGAWQEIRGREIVLAAGAVHSPAILMRSGIGPAASLHALGIPVLHAHEGVGRHFMDHPVMRAMIHLKPEHRSRERDARHTNCCVTYSSHLAGGGERDMILVAYNHRNGATEPGAFGALGAGLYNAFSRGEVSLTSSDPEADPMIEENMLSDPRDRVRMRDGVRRLAVLCAHPAVAALYDDARIGESAFTPAEACALSEEALDELMLREAGDIQHAAGTCRMSAHGDPAGVVDPDLRVRGVEGLRVCDAAIMPADCRANLHFTCVMIGENLARRMRQR